MRIAVRVSAFLVLSGAIWAGDLYAQRKLIEPVTAAPAAQWIGDDAAERNLEVRQQRQTALVGAGVAANFFAAIACFAPFGKKPARAVADQQVRRE
jgi:hypothetical protein